MDITKNPPPDDQGLAFQTHALQMILFGPFLRASPTLLRFVANCALTNIMVDEQVKGNMEHDIFKTTTWQSIMKTLNEQTGKK